MQKQNCYMMSFLKFIRPVVLALIVSAGVVIAKSSVDNYWHILAFVGAFLFIHFKKTNPIFYIIIGAIGGIVCGL